MKKLLTIISLFIYLFAHAQGDPKGVPSSKTRWAEVGWGQSDSGQIFAHRDTLFTPRYPFTTIGWQHAGVDSVLWMYDGFKWNKVGSGSGGSQNWDDVLKKQTTPPTPMSGSYTVDWGSNNFIMSNLGTIEFLTGSFDGDAGSGAEINASSDGILLYAQNSDDSIFSSFSALNTGTIAAAGTNLTGTFSNSISLTADNNINISSASLDYSMPLDTRSDFNYVMVQGNADEIRKTTFPDFADSLQPYLLSGDTTFQWSVDSTVNAPPVGTGSGSKVRVGTSPSGAFIGHNNQIATSDGVGGFTYQTATSGDLLYDANTDLVSKWNGSVWTVVGRAAIHQGLDRFGAAMKIGTGDNFGIGIWTNNVQRMIISNTGIPRFIPLTGAASGLMGLSTTGVGSNVQVGSGLQLLAGTLSATATAPSFQQTLDVSSAVNKNNAVTGSFTFTFNTSRFIANVSDSIQLAASNDIGITSLGTTRVTAATIRDRAATATYSASTLASFGVDSVGFRMQNGKIYGLGFATYTTEAAAKPFQQDTLTGEIIRKSIDLASSINVTGTLAYGNGGTGATSFTNHGVVVAGATALTTVAPSTSGNILTSNGTDWVSSAAASGVWSRTVYGALASTNIIQPTTIGDSVAIGSGITTLAKFTNGGTTILQGKVGIQGAPDATYALKISTGSVSAWFGSNTRIDGSLGVGIAADPVFGNPWMSIQTATTAAAASLVIGNSQNTTNGAQRGVYQAVIQNQTSNTSVVGFTAFTSIISQSASSTVNSGYFNHYYAESQIQTTSSNHMSRESGFGHLLAKIGSGSEIIDVSRGFFDSTSTSAATQLAGIYAAIDLQAQPTTLATTIYGIRQLDNATAINTFQSKSGFGSTTAPTAWVYLGAGTTANSQIRFVAGVAPTSPNDGDHWYEDTNDRLMFRQNATSVELIGASAVNVVSPTAPNRTITVSINGTTYYISAKTTND